jgi:UPF0271 protein
MAAVDYELSYALDKAVYDYNENLIFVALADRSYEEDGTLVSRNKKGAVLHDDEIALARVLEFVEKRKVTTITGKEIDISPDTICLHGDNEQAVLFAERIKQTFTEKVIRIVPVGQE